MSGSAGWWRWAGPVTDTDRDHVLLSPATSVQVFPSPRLSRAPINVSPKPVQRLVVSLRAEQIEQAFARQPIGQHGGLLLRAYLPQAVEQPGNALTVDRIQKEMTTRYGDVLGGAIGQRGDLVLCSSLPQAVQQSGDATQAAEFDVHGRIAGQQRGDLRSARANSAGLDAAGDDKRRVREGTRVVAGPHRL
jgi:hypothetical protein